MITKGLSGAWYLVIVVINLLDRNTEFHIIPASKARLRMDPQLARWNRREERANRHPSILHKNELGGVDGCRINWYSCGVEIVEGECVVINRVGYRAVVRLSKSDKVSVDGDILCHWPTGPLAHWL